MLPEFLQVEAFAKLSNAIGKVDQLFEPLRKYTVYLEYTRAP